MMQGLKPEPDVLNIPAGQSFADLCVEILAGARCKLALTGSAPAGH